MQYVVSALILAGIAYFIYLYILSFAILLVGISLIIGVIVVVYQKSKIAGIIISCIGIIILFISITHHNSKTKDKSDKIEYESTWAKIWSDHSKEYEAPLMLDYTNQQIDNILNNKVIYTER